MNNTDEIGLRQWCLEFISKDRSFESVENLTNDAGKLLNWIRGGEVKSYGEHTYVKYPIRTHTRNDDKTKAAPLAKGRFIPDTEVDDADWTGFKMHHATSGDGHRLQAPDGKYVCLPVPISLRNAERPLKELWVSIYGIPNKGSSNG